MNIDITILYLFVGLSFGLVAIGYLFRYAIPASLFLFTAGGLMAVLFIYTETISTATFISGDTDNIYHYLVDSATGTNSYSNVNFGYVELVSASNSALAGDTIDCIDVYMSRTLNPVGTAEIGTFDVNNNVIVTFGTQNVALLSGALQWFTYCLPDGQTYTIQNGDRIGMKYASGTATDLVNIRGDANNPFDGTVTFRQVYTTVWTSATGTDQVFRFYLRGGDIELTDNQEPFTEEIKVFMVLMASIMCLAGGVMEIEARRR